MSSALDSAAPNLLAALLHLETRARAVLDLPALDFVIANETWQMAPYRQAAVFRRDALGRLTLTTVSGLAMLEGDSPFSIWVTGLANHLSAASPGPRAVGVADVPQTFREDWSEWLPAHVLLLPLAGPDGERLGVVLYGREEPWSDALIAQLARLHETYGYCVWALGRGASLQSRIRTRLRRSSWWFRGSVTALLLTLLMPVRMSVLAPAEVIALEAQVVAAPMDGVIESFAVQPNDAVTRDQWLLSLDRTTLASRREVAQQALEVSRADALVAAQKAFDSDESRAELAVLQGRVREREAELAFLDGQLARVQVRAPADGVAVFGDPNDWIGRPVQTGERLMLLADPAEPGVLIWLPVADAINLEPGAEIRVFLSVAPLAPLRATLTQTSYQATVSPDGVAAYRVRGSFEGAPEGARIGLRGTAKVYGDRYPLIYLVLRRPLATLRAWAGL